MRSYEAARSLFSFLGFMAWSVIIIGVLVALVGAGGGSRYGGPGAALLAMVPGFAIAIAGFIQLAFVQMGRASVDTAEYTQQMLKISRDQLEVSQQALRGNASTPTAFKTGNLQEKSASKSNLGRSGFEQMSKSQPSENRSFAPAIGSGEPQKVIEHMGQKILLTDGRFTYDAKPFESIDLAKQEIEEKHFMFEYKGMFIKARDGKYICNRKPFGSFEAAKAYIDDYNSF